MASNRIGFSSDINLLNGNIGVGTTNPQAKLHLVGDTLVTGITTSYWKGSQGTLFSIINNLSSGSIFSVCDISGIPSIDVDATGTIAIAPYGNNLSKVGIGTTNPQQKLHVVGNALVSGNLGIGTTNPLYILSVVGSGASTTSGLTNVLADFTANTNSFSQINTRNISTSTNASSDIIATADTGTDTTNFIDLGINNSGYSTSTWTVNGALDGYLYTSNTNLSIGVAATNKYVSIFAGGTLSSNEKLRVNTTGVGIGTTNPQSTLHVLGNVLVAAGSSVDQYITQKPYELSNGTLSWEGSAGQLFSITNSLSTGSIFSVNDISGIPSIDVDAGGAVTLGAYGGNIGVGTTNPTSKLHVVGSVLVNTASGFSGNILDLQVGGTSRVWINAAGVLNFGSQGIDLNGQNISVGKNSIGGGNGVILNLGGSGNLQFTGAASVDCFSALYIGPALQLPSAGSFKWSNSSNSQGTSDLVLLRDAANTLALRNGTAAQTFRLYNTYTDASNYERAKLEWSGNTFRVGTERLGTGSTANTRLDLQTNGTTRVAISTTGLVGIGTTNPTSSLHVVGDTLVTGITTSYWRGSEGTLFSIINNLSSGSIFSVCDISGIPSIDVDATGTISIGPYGGNLSKVGIGTTNPTSKLHVVGAASIDDIRIASSSEKATLVSGNTVSLVYNTGGGNVAICTNPTGPITLNVTGIPTDSTFDNRMLTFSVVAIQTSIGYACTAITLNGVSRTIRYPGAVVSTASTSSYDIFNLTGINTVGSASTTANYQVLGIVNGNFK